MNFTAWKQLQNDLQTGLQRIESVLMRRENVIRLLVGRLLLMLMMVIGFWVAMRHSA